MSRLRALICLSTCLTIMAMLLCVRSWDQKEAAMPVLVVYQDQHQVIDELAYLDFGEQPTQQEFKVPIHISNPTAAPRRIIGVSPSCGKNCCYSPEIMSHIEVPPQGEIEYTCSVYIPRPGPFVCHMKLFLDDCGLRKVTLIVKGTGIETEKDAVTRKSDIGSH